MDLKRRLEHNIQTKQDLMRGDYMRKRKMYLLERIKDGTDWKKGDRIWADARCSGWRVIRIIDTK